MKAGTTILFCRAAGYILLGDYLILALQRDPASSIPVLVGVTALAVILLATLFHLGGKDEIPISPAAILGFALAMRLLFLFQPPFLSDDIYRYVWDGLQTLQGHNPYSLTPATSAALDGAAAAILKRINHPEFFTIYPPSAQVVFASGALAGNWIGMKAVLILLDLAACGVLIALLRAVGLPAWRSILYAWHPLPVIEIAWSGHIDGAAILFLLMALLFILRPRNASKPAGSFSRPVSRGAVSRPLFGGMALAVSILTKLVPLIYLPLILSGAFAPVYVTLGIIVAALALSVLFFPGILHMFTSLGIYLQHWEFANFGFRALRTFLGSGNAARMVLACLLISAVAFIVLNFRRQEARRPDNAPLHLMESLYFITLAFLLLNPTLHPWYALYLAAFLPFAANPAGLILSWAVFLSYHVMIRYAILGEWRENDVVAAAIWLSTALAAVSTWAATLSGRLFLRIVKRRAH
jgi:hypothetical protein